MISLPRHAVASAVRRDRYRLAGRDRTLLLWVSGDVHRTPMPIPTFLQHLPADEVGVALLRAERGHGYRRGIRSVGDDRPSSVRRAVLPVDSVHVMPVPRVDHNSIIHVIRERQLGRLLASSLLPEQRSPVFQPP